MTRRVLYGVPASSGTAIGLAAVPAEPEQVPTGRGGGPNEQRQALDALARLAEDLALQADAASENGRFNEADILASSRLIVEDPVLRRQVEEVAAYSSASDALLGSTERYAAQLEELPHESIAARAADVRELGRRAVRLLTGAPLVTLSSHPTVVVARDLGPADVMELELRREAVQGIALAAGSAVSHVAIMARTLGLPLVVGLGGELLEVNDDDVIMLDGDRGEVIVEPGGNLSTLIERAARERERQVEHLRQDRRLPVTTRDGRSITLLCNAASAGEAAAGVANGAEGIGLLRTEFAFLRAGYWPTRFEHQTALRSTFSVVQGRVATVRTLDFGYDKLPPFLVGTTDRGLALTLAHPEALCDQLRAIVTLGTRSRLRVLFPFVRNIDELQEARDLLTHVVRETDPEGHLPLVGAMIETPDAVTKAEEIAAACDFLAVGTNDLVQHSLELDRSLWRANIEAAADPTVLALVLKAVEAAHSRGLRVEICGEAAAVPSVLSLLVGLGVDEVSVAPARLALARDTVRALTASGASMAARRALAASSVDEALGVTAGLLASSPSFDEGSEPGDRVDRVLS